MEDFKTINWRILCYFKLNIKWLICIKNRILKIKLKQ